MLHVNIESKTYRKNGVNTQVLSGIAFSIGPGTIFSLYGPSGCGKSTLLRIVAGLDREYEGHVRLGSRSITRPQRDIGFTVQSQVPYDWLTVAENISFGFRYVRENRQRGWLGRLHGRANSGKAREEAEMLAEIVGLSRSDLDKYPSELSGGMVQRMVFARALQPRPKVLLLDEPFSALDFDSRQSLQEVVLRVKSMLQTSFICVSHDPEEVLYLADRILVMSHTPARIIKDYHTPVPHKNQPAIRYSQEFQQAKQELRSNLENSNRGKSQEIENNSKDIHTDG